MRSLIARLERLEHRQWEAESAVPDAGPMIQLGRMKALPASYIGERHVVVTSCVKDDLGRDFFEWEERPDTRASSVARSRRRY